MPVELKFFIIGLTVGILVPYIINLLDILINLINLIGNYFTNLQTLQTSKTQLKIDNLANQYEVKEPCIGFRVEPQEEYYEQEQEDKARIGFRV